jgi:hypothetical protein
LPDHLDTARQAIEDQLASLRQQLQRLEAAHTALDGEGTPRRRPGRPRGSTRSATDSKAGGKRGSARSATRTGTTRRRRSSSPTRADQALELVKANPGITIPELADRMGIKHNYLYRVLPTLQTEKKVTKRDKGWHATSS